MKAYIFKSDYEKVQFYVYCMGNMENVKIFELDACVGVRQTLTGDFHLLKNIDYKSIEFIDSLDELIFRCN